MNLAEKFCRLLIFLTTLFFGLAIPSHLIAGGSSVGTVVVVNEDSASSKAIANLYVQLREIPPQNVIYLSGIPDGEETTVEKFRTQILVPLMSEIDRRKLASQVDCIAYSADFPSAIKIAEDMKKIKSKLSRIYTKTASINALTYFYQLTQLKNPGYIGMERNWYTRLSVGQALKQPFLGEDQAKYLAACEKSGLNITDTNRDGEPEIRFSDPKLEECSESLEELERLLNLNERQPATYYVMARCHAALGDEKACLENLEKSVRFGWYFHNSLFEDPAFADYKTTEKFKEILAKIPDSQETYLPSVAFRAGRLWTPNGFPARTKEEGGRFLMSTVLAITRNRGTSLEQAEAYLNASAQADFSNPKGTFYFTTSKDVRTRTRQPRFASAIQSLSRLGQKGAIVKGKLPTGKDDIIGLMVGTPGYNFGKSKSKLIPGAICDNLTSLGGVMRKNGGQTPLSEFLKYGAAGSSGTVTEPYALQNKFPLPYIHVHYARGCNLAESFYQTVYGPYQLLIVGDPLCQPFAKKTNFDVVGLSAKEEVSGAVELAMLVSDQKTESVKRYEIYLDGTRRAVLNPDKPLRFDSKKMSDGYHELRILAIENTRIETATRAVIPFTVNNLGESVSLKSSNGESFSMDSSIQLVASSKLSGSCSLWHNGRVLSKSTKDQEQNSWTFDVKASTLGKGKCNLFATVENESKSIVSSWPIEVEVKN